MLIENKSSKLKAVDPALRRSVIAMCTATNGLVTDYINQLEGVSNDAIACDDDQLKVMALRGASPLSPFGRVVSKLEGAEAYLRKLSEEWRELRAATVEIMAFAGVSGDKSPMANLGGELADCVLLLDALSQELNADDVKSSLGAFYCRVFHNFRCGCEQCIAQMSAELILACDHLEYLLMRGAQEGNMNGGSIIATTKYWLKEAMLQVMTSEYPVHIFFEAFRGKIFFNLCKYHPENIQDGLTLVGVTEELEDFFSLPRVRSNLVVRYGDKVALTFKLRKVSNNLNP